MTHQDQILPVIDLSHFPDTGTPDPVFLDEIRVAAHDFGFFYLTGTGIPSAVEARVIAQADRFFARPDGEKEQIAMVRSPHFRGYNRTGLEVTRGRSDWREQVDIGAERDAVARTPDTPAYWRLQGPNQWPEGLPDFRDGVLAWQEHALNVLRRVLRALALSLGQDPGVFEASLGETPHQLLKLIHYPGSPHGEEGQGVGPHKDSGLLSLILQDDIGGLEVETKAGVWIAAPPRPDTVVVNIGELLEVATSGYFRAAIHRVVSPKAGRSRLSVAFFLSARLDATVPTLDLPHFYANAAGGVTRDPENPLFSQIGQNTLKGRLRSHPDVAARHHADLLLSTQPEISRHV